MRHFDLLFFVILPAVAAAATATAAAVATSHTLTHCYAGYAHQRTTHTYIYAYTEALDVVNRGSLFFSVFLSLVTLVVYNLTQFNYIRIAVRYIYIYWTKSRRRDD